MQEQQPKPSSAARKKLIIRYFAFVRPYKYHIAVIIILGVLQFAVPLIGPWMTKVMIDQVFPGKAGYWTLNKVVLLLGAAYIFGNIGNFFRNRATAHLGHSMMTDIRKQMYEHLQKLSQRYYETRQVGSITSRVLHDVNGAQNLIGGGLINIVIDLFLVLFAGYMLFHLNMWLALLALWLLPLYYLTFTNLNVRIRFAWRSTHRQMERMSGVLVERMGGMKVVQSFNREQTELERFTKQANHHYRFAMTAQFLSNLLGRISQTFSDIGGLLIWFAGGTLVLRGNLTIGELIAFQAYLSQLYGPIQRFAEVNVTVQNSLTNIERIFEVFDIEPEIVDKENPVRIPQQCEGDLAFENVSFSYMTEHPAVSPKQTRSGDYELVEKFKPAKRFYWIPPKTAEDPPPTVSEKRVALKNVSFHAKSGEVIALVGPSGAGKSTLINFIPRFYDPDEGRILLDGIELKDYEINDLRRQIALVLQENILFSGTVYENIAYGRAGASREEVEAAARAANAHDFIMSWDTQYDTVLGERGMRLSGGQKQRVAIARALLKDPRILILDEATSALDAESEALVTEALEGLMRGRTTFIIAHRLATVVRADQILVLDEGEIIERGTHERLLQQGGMYRDLYEKQLKAMRPEEMMKHWSLL